MTRGLTWPKNPTDPWVAAAIQDARLADLERKLHGTEVPPFSAAGAFPAQFFGTPWFADEDYDVWSVRFSLGTAGSTDTDCELYLDGVLAESVTIASGDLTTRIGRDALSMQEIISESYLQPKAVTRGTDALDLTCQVRLYRRGRSV